MILRKIDYHEFDEEPNYWALKELTLGKINLFVGKNATGKTNTLTKIAWLGNMLAGLRPQLLKSGSYDVQFADDDVYKYNLSIYRGNVISEKLEINGDVKLIRSSDGTGKIYANELKQEIKFQLPANQLVAVARRDTIQHPYLKKLSDWADGMKMYAFGSSMKQEYGKRLDAPDSIINGNSDNTVEVFIAGNLEFDNEYKEVVLSSMQRIGYDLTDVDAICWPHSEKYIEYKDCFLFVVEKEGNITINQSDMSQGMFRALSIIIHITYHVLMKTTGTIIIDDIGEGLDFDRSSKLIQLLMEIAENNNIQLIMSTNDRFVMNNVPLEYWQVIQRKGGECQAFNYQNSKEKFDEFEYTGLNNFDFLRTDFINSNWETV